MVKDKDQLSTNMSKVAHKYLCTCATSVPERTFSTGGNIVAKLVTEAYNTNKLDLKILPVHCISRILNFTVGINKNRFTLLL